MVIFCWELVVEHALVPIHQSVHTGSVVCDLPEIPMLVASDAQDRVDEKPAQDEVARLNVVLHQRAVFDGQTRAHLNADPPVERAENVALKLEGRQILEAISGARIYANQAWTACPFGCKAKRTASISDHRRTYPLWTPLTISSTSILSVIKRTEAGFKFANSAAVPLYMP